MAWGRRPWRPSAPGCSPDAPSDDRATVRSVLAGQSVSVRCRSARQQTFSKRAAFWRRHQLTDQDERLRARQVRARQAEDEENRGLSRGTKEREGPNRVSGPTSISPITLPDRSVMNAARTVAPKSTA